ncbi:MAG TPA: uroporphyrinogen-III synthase [Caulobacteraceae bacterium]|nr:uroporphyrinogen-III synthase [Caulobacteraceae bacterium]
MTPPHTLWITRAQPGADATARRLEEIRLSSVVAPLLVVEPIPGAAVDLADAAAIVFTSANAVAAFAALSPERSLRVFAVGDATAGAARGERFRNVLSTQGDVHALAAALAARRRELRGVIVYPAAAEPAQDLAAALAPAGLTVRQTAVYETVAAPPPASLLARLPEIDGVLLHSAKAAGALAEVLLDHPAPHITAYCLSRQVAAPLHGADLAGVRVAPAPNEAALLALLESLAAA